ncbi:hypothetical protein [Streptococcus halichoeri]|uniref:hypothetical protein n=1 Tax=Streptococcus halichoeri TaxID=254785 RepID=UPI00135B586E|nr:hypothetical protein [Streptococcus halichoeri]
MPNNTRFPVIADNQPIIEASKMMQLYENEDLITNIHGPYQDKQYDDVTKDYRFLDVHNSSNLPKDRLNVINEGRTYAEQARQKAKQDIREKRQAYFAKEMAYSSSKQASSLRPKNKEADSAVIKPTVDSKTAPKQRSKNKWSLFSEKLRQEAYILAELPREYKEPQTDSKPKVTKNNYDFLKTSQIYNNRERRLQREKTIAQELNLTRLDEFNQQQ